MATRFTAQDIINLIRESQSDEPDDGEVTHGNFTTDTRVTPFVGKKKNILGISKGFKLRERETKLDYTVVEIELAGKDVIMTLESGTGAQLKITSKDFKNYERQ